MKQSSLLEIGKIFRGMWCFHILSARVSCAVCELTYIPCAYGFQITAMVSLKHIENRSHSLARP